MLDIIKWVLTRIPQMTLPFPGIWRIFALYLNELLDPNRRKRSRMVGESRNPRFPKDFQSLRWRRSDPSGESGLTASMTIGIHRDWNGLHAAGIYDPT